MKNTIIDDSGDIWYEKILDTLHRIFIRPFYDLKYYIRIRFIYRHHLINTKLKIGQWYDIDIRLLYGMMSLLEDFIEKETPFDIVEYDNDEYSRYLKNEMLEIYNWWKDYKHRQNEIDQALDNWYKNMYGNEKELWNRINISSTISDKRRFDLIQQLEDKLYKEETEMLIRLIKIRKGLWT